MKTFDSCNDSLISVKKCRFFFFLRNLSFNFSLNIFQTRIFVFFLSYRFSLTHRYFSCFFLHLLKVVLKMHVDDLYHDKEKFTTFTKVRIKGIHNVTSTPIKMFLRKHKSRRMYVLRTAVLLRFAAFIVESPNQFQTNNAGLLSER